MNTNVTCHSTGAYNRVKKWRPVCCETLQLSRVITADSESHKALWQAYDLQQRNKTNKETTKTDRSGTLAPTVSLVQAVANSQLSGEKSFELK